MKWFSKTLVIVTIVSLLGLFVPLTNKNVTHAQIGISVPAFESNPILVGSVINLNTQTLLEWAQEFVLSTLKKRLLDMMVDQIIQWIQGGGKPKFVSDWQGLLRDAGNAAIGDFAQEIGAGFLCSPFNLRIQFDLRFKRFTQEATCTLDSIVGNIEAFYDNFRNGGWLGYTSTWEPANNYFGASLLAHEEQQKRAHNAQYAAELEATSGGGFLSTKTCDEEVGGTGPDIDGDGKRGDISSTCEITTPGKIIGGVTSKAIESDIDSILTAEQLSEYVSAIAQAAINRLVMEGVDGLLGLTTKNAPPGGGIPPGTGQCVGLTGKTLLSCRNYINSSNNSFSAARSNIIEKITAVLVPREEAQAFVNNSINKTNDYVLNLEELIKEFEKLPISSCLLKDLHIKNLKAEIQRATGTLPDLKAKKDQNQKSLDELNKAINDLKALEEDDWVQFSTTVNQITNSGLLDLDGAKRIKEEFTKENKDITNLLNKNLDGFNDELRKCQKADRS